MPARTKQKAVPAFPPEAQSAEVVAGIVVYIDGRKYTCRRGARLDLSHPIVAHIGNRHPLRPSTEFGDADQPAGAPTGRKLREASAAAQRRHDEHQWRAEMERRIADGKAAEEELTAGYDNRPRRSNGLTLSDVFRRR